MKRWLIGFGAFLLGVALLILGRDGRQLRRVEVKRDNLIAGGIDSEIKKAEQLNKKAEKHKADADRAAAVTIEKLETLREKDHDMDDLLSAWQSERVRQQSS